MKPPRIFPRGKYFWIEYWNPQTKKKERKPITDAKGITLAVDIPVPQPLTPEWWKKSKHRKAISAFIDEVQYVRMKLARWEQVERPRRDLSIYDLKKLYEDDRELKGGEVTADTQVNRDVAVRFLKRYGVKSIRQVTLDKVLEIRRSSSETHSPGTVKEYFKRLSPMFALAVKKKLLEENPFDGVKIEVVRSGGHAPPLSVQIEQFERLYGKDPMLCAQVLYLRLGGYRAKDSCTLEVEHVHFESKTLRVRNNKGKRWETNPMSDALFLALRWVVGDRTSGFVFPVRTGPRLYYHVSRVTGGDLHTYKDCYADELAPFTESDDLKKYLMHHQPESIAMRHYQKPPVEQGREVLNQAQKELLAWVQNGYALQKSAITEH